MFLILKKDLYMVVSAFLLRVNLWGGVYAYKKHVSMVFSRGNELQDPESYLEGNGKYRRHLKIFDVDDLVAKDASYFAKQVVELAVKGRGD